MRTIYFDCFSGISGDMTLAALVDAGARPEKLELGLSKLFQQNVKLYFDTVVKKGVSAKKLRIELDGKQYIDQASVHHDHEHSHRHDHDHDHEHSHHHDHDHHHEHSHHHDHDHHHEHSHHHDHDHHHEHNHHHDHDHNHRHYRDIVRMIEQAQFPQRVTERALRVFEEIGKAEAKIHNMALENVHFHEVGAIDSIIDIVGTALALEDLEIDEVFASPVAVGTGYVKCDHGLYPVPAPATLELLRNIPIRKTEERGELATPTGVGILAALAGNFGSFPAFTVRSIGYGAGTKELVNQPNVLRVVIGEIDN